MEGSAKRIRLTVRTCGQLTFGTTFSFLPWLYSDFEMAVSRRWMTLLSSFWKSGRSQRGDRKAGDCGQESGRTVALVMVNSISPRCAPINVENFSQTPSSIPSLLFSARVCRKFFTVSPLSTPPMCFWSSCTICDLSPGVRLGAWRMTGSLGSFLNTSDKAASDLAVFSSAEVLAAAVYCTDIVINPRKTWAKGCWPDHPFGLESITYQSARVRSIKAKQCDWGLRVYRHRGLSVCPHSERDD